MNDTARYETARDPMLVRFVMLLALIAILSALAVFATGCTAHPEPGADLIEVAAAYGVPDRRYNENDERVWEWRADGDWRMRSYFRMIQYVELADGTVEIAQAGSTYPSVKGTFWKWELRETVVNWQQAFYRHND